MQEIEGRQFPWQGVFVCAEGQVNFEDVLETVRGSACIIRVRGNPSECIQFIPSCVEPYRYECVAGMVSEDV